MDYRASIAPHPNAKLDWQKVQELNLHYVAITRAQKELCFMSKVRLTCNYGSLKRGMEFKVGSYRARLGRDHIGPVHSSQRVLRHLI